MTLHHVEDEFIGEAVNYAEKASSNDQETFPRYDGMQLVHKYLDHGECKCACGCGMHDEEDE